jgi:hypothetical protein
VLFDPSLVEQTAGFREGWNEIIITNISISSGHFSMR